MSRNTEDAEITTRAARQRLAARHDPYWRGIAGGLALGYRKGARGGVWMARLWEAGHYRKATLGRADDTVRATLAGTESMPDSGDTKVLDFRQAQAKAQDWARRLHRVAAGLEPEPAAAPSAPYTVSDAIRDYLADYAARGGKALYATRNAAEANILPTLGTLPVPRLTRDKLKDWHRSLAALPARIRSPKGQTRRRNSDGDTEAPRRRRSTANRVLATLKAALNHARAEGRISCSPDAWAAVKLFREASKPRVRYLLDDELTRLVNACPPDFRELVSAALLTGCRYGELAAMKAGDFDPQAGTLTIGRSKGGKPRHVALTDEGRALFERMTAGKAGTARLFERDRRVQHATREMPVQKVRVAWARSDQSRLMREACAAATIAPAVTFHELRHTYGSRLAMRSVPMGVIAAQLGHADTRMTERHYAHLSPSYITETVRRSFGSLGIVPDTSTVTPLRRSLTLKTIFG
jgi:integrase